MIVCVCHAISEREIREWVSIGGRSFVQLQDDTGLGTCCGKCRETAVGILGGMGAMEAVTLSRDRVRQEV